MVAGKSTILDALSFVLFGKPYRNIKLGQLVNRFNDKDLEVEVNFDIGSDNYTIFRGYKPAKFKLTKNGQDLDVLSAKKLNQEEIDKLLGINYVLFKNIVAVASIYNKPFLMLSAGERRSLIETIFNIYVLALMLKEVKRRNTVNQTQQRLNLTTLTGLTEQRTTAEKFVNETEQIIERFEQNKANAIAQLVADIFATQETIDKCNRNISIADKKLVELQDKIDASEAVQELANINAAHNAAAIKIGELNQKLSVMSTNAKCPICNSDLTGEHAAAHIKELQDEIDNQNKILADNTKSTELKELIAKISKNKSLYDTIILKKTEQVNLLNNSKTQLTNLNTKKEQQENSKCEINVEQYKTQLTGIINRINAVTADINELDNKIRLDGTLIDILGDAGLKTYFFKQLLPQLNSQVNNYISAFGLQVTLEFDKNLDAKIQQGKYECEYMGFSAGERARIDVAILLSFFDISRNISNWSCNTLFIDEVMDSGVDADGTSQFISTLFNVVTNSTAQNDLGIYIISHKLSNIDVAWDSVVEINKTSRFSELKVTKNNESSSN